MFIGGRFYYWGFIKSQYGDDYEFRGLTDTNAEPLSMVEKLARSQQYTGFHDNNGVEIYEGDILKNGNTYGNAPKLIEVVWNEREGAFNGKVGAGRLPLSCAYWFFVNCEVISNICEHSHLLKGGVN